jgi:SAM-dependent methyltransferase
VELLIGCGSNRTKKLTRPGREQWSGLVTLDMNDAHKPDVVHDIASLPLPFADDTFDEIHAYDTLEHVGRQGDWAFFFAQWSDFWRLLKPDGVFFGISPHWSSAWCWGDPGHTRVVSAESFVFLSQPAYSQVGTSPMTDYRFCYRADFDLIHNAVSVGQLQFALRAIKPARIAS